MVMHAIIIIITAQPPSCPFAYCLVVVVSRREESFRRCLVVVVDSWNQQAAGSSIPTTMIEVAMIAYRQAAERVVVLAPLSFSCVSEY